MKYVLDTCTYFWLVDDQTKLSAPALAAMGDTNDRGRNKGFNLAPPSGLYGRVSWLSSQ